MNFIKDFMWNRILISNTILTKSWSVSKRLWMPISTNLYYTPEIGKEHYAEWRDSVWSQMHVNLGNQQYAYHGFFLAIGILPINKFLFFDWITANASYNSNYNWNRSAKPYWIPLIVVWQPPWVPGRAMDNWISNRFTTNQNTWRKWTESTMPVRKEEVFRKFQ